VRPIGPREVDVDNSSNAATTGNAAPVRLPLSRLRFSKKYPNVASNVFSAESETLFLDASPTGTWSRYPLIIARLAKEVSGVSGGM
jgi:hypothetical protein